MCTPQIGRFFVMGSLTEAIYGYRGTRPVYSSRNYRYNPRTGRFQRGPKSGVSISGFVENEEMFEHLLTYEPRFDQNVRKVIKQVLREARNKLSRDARNYIKNDPRKAARAVKHTVYKEVFGGNLSILAKRKAGRPTNYEKPRTLKPKQRGGNRRSVNPRTYQMEHYFGSDRGFALRFLNAGTIPRYTQYGNRGMMAPTDWFGHTAPWQMEAAAQNVAEAINEYINHQANG